MWCLHSTHLILPRGSTEMASSFYGSKRQRTSALDLSGGIGSGDNNFDIDEDCLSDEGEVCAASSGGNANAGSMYSFYLESQDQMTSISRSSTPSSRSTYTSARNGTGADNVFDSGFYTPVRRPGQHVSFNSSTPIHNMMHRRRDENDYA